MDAVGELRVRLPRALRVRPRENPVALAIGDERSLEVRDADRARVVDALRELERALDVVARGLVVALPAPAARAPREDVGLQRVARQARALGKRERLVEESDRRLRAVELVAAAAEPEEDVGALDVGERARLGQRPRLGEELERRAVVAEPHLRQTGPDERPNLELGAAGRARRGNSDSNGRAASASSPAA